MMPAVWSWQAGDAYADAPNPELQLPTRSSRSVHVTSLTLSVSSFCDRAKHKVGRAEECVGMQTATGSELHHDALNQQAPQLWCMCRKTNRSPRTCRCRSSRLTRRRNVFIEKTNETRNQDCRCHNSWHKGRRSVLRDKEPKSQNVDATGSRLGWARVRDDSASGR